MTNNVTGNSANGGGRGFRGRFQYASMSFLLGVQLLLIFGLGPLLSLGVQVSAALSGFILPAVITVVLIAQPKLIPSLVVIGALLFNAAAAVLVHLATASDVTFWMDGVGSIISIAGLSWIVAQLVFSPGHIDRHRITGSIVLYLNMALLFEVLFRLVEGVYPGAFSGLAADAGRTHLIAELMYFSMTTLTTVGYGDIVAVHPIARSLANMESLFGQLYPAIILARMMTLYRVAA